MLAQEGNLLNVTWLCKNAGVSRSGYYHYIATEELRIQREKQDRQDFEIIVLAYQYKGYNKGARGIYMRLLHMNPPFIMNIKKIRRFEYFRRVGLISDYNYSTSDSAYMRFEADEALKTLLTVARSQYISEEACYKILVNGWRKGLNY